MELANIRYALTRIQMEYIEMPEMKLTLAQVRRLLDLPIDDCEVALATLVQSGFLKQASDRGFLRGASIHIPLGRHGQRAHAV
jgi:hypothetical protein